MTKDIKQARTEAEAARAKLSETIGELRYRTTPSVLAHDVANAASKRAHKAMASGDAALRSKPWLPWAIGVALGGVAALRFTRRRHPGTKLGVVNTR